MSQSSDRGVRYTDKIRALIATLLGDLSFTEVQSLLSGKAPTYPTLKAIADEYVVTPPQSKRGRKVNPATAKPAKAKLRGRPPGSKNKGGSTKSTKRGRRYDDAAKVKLVVLIEQHGLTGTMNVLGDESPSIVTLHNIAKEAGVELTRGRPKVVAAA